MAKDRVNQNNFQDFSDEELIVMKKKLIERYRFLEEEWAIKLSKIWTDKFDQYSARGKRKLDKLTKTYADKLSDMEIVFEELKEELLFRELSVVDLEDITDEVDESRIDEETDQLDENEYISREIEKTRQIREDNKLDD